MVTGNWEVVKLMFRNDVHEKHILDKINDWRFILRQYLKVRDVYDMQRVLLFLQEWCLLWDLHACMWLKLNCSAWIKTSTQVTKIKLTINIYLWGMSVRHSVGNWDLMEGYVYIIIIIMQLSWRRATFSSSWPVFSCTPTVSSWLFVNIFFHLG